MEEKWIKAIDKMFEYIEETKQSIIPFGDIFLILGQHHIRKREAKKILIELEKQNKIQLVKRGRKCGIRNINNYENKNSWEEK